MKCITYLIVLHVLNVNFVLNSVVFWHTTRGSPLVVLIPLFRNMSLRDHTNFIFFFNSCTVDIFDTFKLTAMRDKYFLAPLLTLALPKIVHTLWK